MRLLYLHNEAFRADKAHVIGALSMCRGFSASGVDTAIAFRRSPRPRAELERLVASVTPGDVGFDVQDVPTWPRLRGWERVAYAIRCRNLIREFGPDVCYVRDPLTAWACLGCGVPTIVESHGARCHWVRAIDAGLQRMIVGMTSHDNFGLLVTISEELKTYWHRQGVPDAKLLALHDGFSEDLFSTHLDRQVARRELGIEAPGPLVVYAGSLYADRGIEAVLDLAAELPNATFLLAGGPERRRQGYATTVTRRGLGNVMFLGQMEHCAIPTLLFAADVLLALWSWKVPSIASCSPLQLFEYMASGRTIVAHAFPTIREVLTNEKNALLADPDSFESLLGQLQRAITISNSSRLGERARELAFSKYTWTRRCQRVLEAIS